MAWVAVAVAGSTLVGGYLNSKAQKSAANTAADAQTRAAQLGIDEQRRQFDQVRGLLSPFVTTGQMAMGEQGRILGFYGPEAQQQVVDQIQQMPAFQSQLKLGENRILANASATGGLRGGNTQAAIGYFAPTLLAQQINDQYARLGGLTSLGENAAAGVGNAGMQTGNNVTSLLGGIGSAQAGAALANGRANGGLVNAATGAFGQYLGQGGQFGGIPTPDAIQGRFAQTGLGQSGFGTGLAYGNQDYGAYI